MQSFSAYLWVTLGSALGGAARFLLIDMCRILLPGQPLGLMAVNGLGSFGAGLVVGFSWLPAGSGLQIFLTAGFLAGFTTLSAFTAEFMSLATGGRPVMAFTVWIFHAFVAIGLCWAGYLLSSQ